MKPKLLILIFILLSQCSVISKEETKDRDVYYIKIDGVQLPVVVSGKNTDKIVLFVHGGPGSSGLLYYYADAWISLRKKYRMAFYDQRGSGGARGHIASSSITVDQHVEDLKNVVILLQTKYPNSKIYLFGHSYGGMISAAFTSIYQDMIEGLMLLSPALNIEGLMTIIPTNIINIFINPY
ncbi:MAG: alpha/beta fold hydrolase, partial [Brevinema sp.]